MRQIAEQLALCDVVLSAKSPGGPHAERVRSDHRMASVSRPSACAAIAVVNPQSRNAASASPSGCS
ncbi:hypothetical protein NOO62_30175 [Streptomyces sp. Je 1-369]|nr:hypothetical protein [Streptomyces sp. Je 1-369]WAL98378.1 hypothetical protein NOO62_30175 [Streptomyces sp. Je 1-369]